MPWACRLIAAPGSAREWLAVRPGDMWFVDDLDEPYMRAAHLAPEHDGKRALVVRLPGPVSFPIYRAPSGGGDAWTVTGTPPAVTLRPSINCHGVYHGYITDGIITDDIEGRRYNDDGTLIRTGQRR